LAQAGGVRIEVRLTPKAARDAVDGLTQGPDGPRLAVRVRALPDQGAANAALARTLAAWLGVPKTSVEVVAGPRSRTKALFIAGDSGELARRLAARLARPR
jgi:uncharacterized protein YggU (UPF0235/DUF167 family)